MKKDAIRAELLTIKAQAKDGLLHAATVVDWARAHKRSALYRKFEWRDDKAAEQFRLWQARELITLYIVDASGAPTVVSLRYDRQRGGGYRDIASVLSSKKLSQMMLADAIADLERVRGRYIVVKELTSVWAALDSIKPKRIAQRSRQSKRKAA